MSSKKISEETLTAWKCLKEIVRKELKKKALLGHDAIIHLNGKSIKISAKEALEMIEKEN
ncbi:MAG: hypothetical protein MI922_01285 [Bacteroidales bacterium]|nr:hypothetical protein [Bacteroidales bacterium]